MKTIAFYISNHGFGHASRNIPIVEKLLKLDDDIKIIIKTDTMQLEFMRQALSNYNSRIVYYDEGVDLGLILKKNSQLVDKDRLKCELNRFISTWEARIEKEKIFLKENEVSFIVSDIVPWIFEAANQLNIKSLLVSNFTWTEIYKELFDSDIPKAYERLYKKADYIFEYPLSGNMSLNTDKVTKAGLSCREFNEKAVEGIKKKFKNPLIFISVGRSVNMDDEIETENLPYDFIYTEGIKLKGANTYKLPINTNNTHDYIKASQVVITKAGWSTVSEAICAKKPIIVLNRSEIKEDENTVRSLLRLNIAKAIEFNQLNSENLKIYIEEAQRLKDNYKLLSERYQNNSEEIATKILELL